MSSYSSYNLYKFNIHSLNLFLIYIPTYTTISYVCQCFFVNIIIFLFLK
nr:MAG TPA: hypothetical protein [Caudoviricetes sp.]